MSRNTVSTLSGKPVIIKIKNVYKPLWVYFATLHSNLRENNKLYLLKFLSVQNYLPLIPDVKEEKGNWLLREHYYFNILLEGKVYWAMFKGVIRCRTPCIAEGTQAHATKIKRSFHRTISACCVELSLSALQLPHGT